MNATSTLLFALAFPACIHGQAPIDSTTYPKPAEYQHALVISAPYDGAQDKTVLQTDPFPIAPTLSLSVLTALDGPRVIKPATSIVFTFWSTAPAGTYTTDHGVVAVLNAHDTLDLGRAWLSPQHRAEYSDVLLKGFSLGQFLALANATTVTIQLGPTRATLSNAQIQGLRDFASRMAPHSQ